MLGDRDESWVVEARRVVHRGHVVTFCEDDVLTPAGETIRREYFGHPGSVIVLALDADDRVAVVNQYRHPMGMRLVECPAGLMDVPGEPPLAAAQRELAEEAGLAAADWRVLVDYCPSPGISDEVGRVFLARYLRPAPRPDGFEAHGEEIDMGLAWVPVADLLAAVRAGRVNNVSLVLGVATLCLARADGSIDALRPGDAPWPAQARVAANKAAREQA